MLLSLLLSITFLLPRLPGPELEVGGAEVLAFSCEAFMLLEDFPDFIFFPFSTTRFLLISYVAFLNTCAVSKLKSDGRCH